MLEDDFRALLDSVLGPLGCVLGPGVETKRPALTVLGFYERSVRVNWVPLLGRTLSLVAVARQPVDLGGDRAGHAALLDRVIATINGRYPPWKGASVALSTIVLTPEPIQPETDEVTRLALEAPRRGRCLLLGLFRINLGQRALSFALRTGPAGLFPEPTALADGLSGAFGRFVPPLTF